MEQRKILVVCASGIGNTILFTPTLRALRKGLPEAEITFLTTKAVFAEPIRGSRMTDKIISLDDGKSLLAKIRLITEFRQEKFDYSITAFPSNRWQFNLFAFLVGAKKRVTHRYIIGRLKTLSFLPNLKIPTDENLNDIDQNLNLLKVLNLTPPKKKAVSFYLSPEAKKWAQKFWQKNSLRDNFVVGIHPGSGGIQQNAKRWPAKKFAELGDQLIKKKKAKILLFGGPEEEKLKEEIKKLIVRSRQNVHLINTSLEKAAALIQKCRLFITNDSGLMHVAAALGVKTIAIFGPTNYQRTAPYKKNYHLVRKNLACSPCLKYPFYSTSSKISCPRNFECFRKIEIEDILCY